MVYWCQDMVQPSHKRCETKMHILIWKQVLHVVVLVLYLSPVWLPSVHHKELCLQLEVKVWRVAVEPFSFWVATFSVLHQQLGCLGVFHSVEWWKTLREEKVKVSLSKDRQQPLFELLKFTFLFLSWNNCNFSFPFHLLVRVFVLFARVILLSNKVG